MVADFFCGHYVVTLAHGVVVGENLIKRSDPPKKERARARITDPTRQAAAVTIRDTTAPAFSLSRCRCIQYHGSVECIITLPLNIL